MTSIPNKNHVIWMNGEYLPYEDASVHILNYSMHYGFAIYEGIRAYETPKGTAIFRLHEHTKRFFRSAHILQFPISYDQETLNKVQVEVVIKNQLPSAYIRPFLYYGYGMGLHNKNLKSNVIVAAWEWGAYLGAENLEKGIRVKTSSIVRNNVNSVFGKAKGSGNYMNSILALQEANNCGFDEALMLDHTGYVAEGSGENFFMIRDNVIYTPEISSALEGITRATIIELAKEMGYTVKEKNITRDEVYIADEAFFTGTAAEVTPIRELDHRQIGDGKRGPITQKLQSRYFEVVTGHCRKHSDWLTYV